MKMIKLTYCKTHWTDDDSRMLIIDEKNKTVLVNLENIATVSPEPVVGREFGSNGTVLADLHFVRTSVGVGCGLNGVDFISFYITEEAYQNLVKNIEVIG